MGSQNLTLRINRLEQNVLLNGNSEFAQRVSPTAMLSNSYHHDRFYANNLSSSMTTLVDQSSTVPSGTSLTKSMRTYNTTTGSLVAGTQVDQRDRIEGYDLQPLMVDEWTLIFWVRSSVAGVYSVSIRNSGSTHSYVRQYTINSANTYELKCIKLPALSTCPGTLDRTNGVGLEIKWSIVTGATFQTGSLNSWNSGNFEAGAGQVTSWLTSGNEFFLAGMMAIQGDWEALTSSGYRFVRAGRDYSDELRRLERYYEKTYSPTIYANGVDGAGAVRVTSSGTAPTQSPGWMYRTTKRAVPTVTVYNPNGGSGPSTAYRVSDAANVAFAPNFPGVNGVRYFQFSSADNEFDFHATVDAEL